MREGRAKRDMSERGKREKGRVRKPKRIIERPGEKVIKRGESK